MICHVDESWPDPDDWRAEDEDEDEEEENQMTADIDSRCLDKFHHIKTVKALREAYHQLGEEVFLRVFNHFTSLKYSGFTIDEILLGDTVFIHRGNQHA